MSDADGTAPAEPAAREDENPTRAEDDRAKPTKPAEPTKPAKPVKARRPLTRDPGRHPGDGLWPDLWAEHRCW